MTASTRRRRGRPSTAERTKGPFAPYGPIRAIDIALSFHRDRGFADPIGSTALERAGVAPSMSPRTLQALRYLGLIDDDGYSTEDMERVRRARDDELPELLATLVRRAYAEVFTQLDPAVATSRQLNDAFRAHEPLAQRVKMVALFRAICVRANLIAQRSTTLSAPPASGADVRSRRGSAPNHRASSTALIRGLLDTLPSDGHWTRAERDRWTSALHALLDLSILVDDERDDSPTRPTHGN